jgi:F0F1-type ATP synthase assembly protein I
MRKRNKKREKRELLSALAMITQIGLSMMTCMALSFAIGYYIDRLCGTKYWVMIFLLIGILAALRSLFILIGRIQPEKPPAKEESDAGSEKDAH